MILRLILLTLASGLLAACGSDAGTGTSSPASSSSSGSAPYRAGTHYERLATPIAGAADNEVVEVFSYACPACAQFQPEIDAWKRERGDAVILRYEPAEFHPAWQPFSRTFHALRKIGAFGRGHRAVFEGLYRSGQQPAQTLDQLADLLAAAGIDRAAFMAAANSPEVDAAMEASRNFVKLAGVGSTPSLVVAGRYRVERNQPDGVKPMAVADWLIANKP
jgi:thiol:disulfide interchange protein DsbA